MALNEPSEAQRLGYLIREKRKDRERLAGTLRAADAELARLLQRQLELRGRSNIPTNTVHSEQG